MPTLQQTIYGVEPLDEVKNLTGTRKTDHKLRYHIRMLHLHSAESFSARSSFSPAYNHNMAATREARTSNIHEDTPRFKDQIDIIA